MSNPMPSKHAPKFQVPRPDSHRPAKGRSSVPSRRDAAVTAAETKSGRERKKKKTSIPPAPPPPSLPAKATTSRPPTSSPGRAVAAGKSVPPPSRRPGALEREVSEIAVELDGDPDAAGADQDVDDAELLTAYEDPDDRDQSAITEAELLDARPRPSQRALVPIGAGRIAQAGALPIPPAPRDAHANTDPTPEAPDPSKTATPVPSVGSSEAGSPPFTSLFPPPATDPLALEPDTALPRRSSPRPPAAPAGPSRSGDSTGQLPSPDASPGALSDPPPPASLPVEAARPVPLDFVPGPPPTPNIAGYPSAPAPTRKPWSALALVALLILGALGAWLYRQQPGSLIVTVSGRGAMQLEKVTVFVDDEQVCSASPCRVNPLESGSHLVRTEVEDLPPTAPQAIIVEPGAEAALNITVEGPRSGTLTVVADADDTQVDIDGKPHGAAPVHDVQLMEGSHVVQLRRLGFVPASLSVELTAGEHKTLGPVSLAPFEAELRVTLDEPAVVRLDGKRIRPPVTVKLDPKSPHLLEAHRFRRGRFEKEIRFTAEHPKQTVNIVLRQAKSDNSKKSEPQVDRAAGAGKAKRHRETSQDSAPTAQQPEEGKSGPAHLDLNSIPESVVLLDGTPLGPTPRRNVTVAAGSHSVTFIHLKLGRKNLNVSLEPGASKSLTAKF
jgi:hypothetical protein